VWLHTLPRAGSLERNLAAAERAASRLEPYAHDPLALQVLGMITLTAALAAASLQRSDTASHWLNEALKHTYGWNRTLLDSKNGAATWCGHVVFAHNLLKISTLAS
jgi:hypothetical protein